MFRLTPVVKNLLIINVVVFILQSLVSAGYVTNLLAMHKIGSDDFRPYQLFTYMFAHGGIGHIFFNMLGLAFLGPLLEQFWGPKRFLIFYLVTGIGAGVLFAGIEYYRTSKADEVIEHYMNDPSPSRFASLADEYNNRLKPQYRQEVIQFLEYYGSHENDPTTIENSKGYANWFLQASKSGIMLGASGAVYGILMAFGLLFPNTKLMLLFPPIPVKAKYLVLALGAYAIYAGFSRSEGDSVAHFAHLGGMIFAFIMIQIWKGQRNKFY